MVPTYTMNANTYIIHTSINHTLDFPTVTVSPKNQQRNQNVKNVSALNVLQMSSRVGALGRIAP